MNRKLGFIDVGARGGIPPKLTPYLPQIDLVLVEPEKLEFENLKSKNCDGTSYNVIGVALGPVDGEVNFFETVNPECSSVLDVDHPFISRYEISQHFAPKCVSPITCKRFDTLYSVGAVPFPHLIKIDVQGYEFQVLEGFGLLLKDCLAIVLEAHFYQLYKDQRLICDIVTYLETHDFILRKLSNPRSSALNGDHHFEGDLIEVDATFTKNRQWALNSVDPVKADFDLACEIVGVSTYRRSGA